MLVAATSDLHGELPEVPECDLLLVAGDVCPADDHSLERQADFITHEFAEWAERAPAKRAAWVAGNHDHLLYRLRPGARDELLRCMPPWWAYLQDGAAELCGLKVYGIPWSLGPDVSGWSFEAQEPGMGPRYEKPGAVRMEDVLADVPVDTDVLVVHGPADGFGDTVGGPHGCSRNPVWLGSSALTAWLREHEPRLCVYGHNHEGHGRWDFEEAGMTLANVSALTDRYELRPDPVTTFELEV